LDPATVSIQLPFSTFFVENKKWVEAFMIDLVLIDDLGITVSSNSGSKPEWR
jgi:hypothetical protein